jgi:hypothetical protein
MPSGIYKRKKMSEDTKIKISIANKGKKPWSFGKKLSEELKRKLSIKRLENRDKLGYVNSPETRLKISATCTGKKFLNRKKPQPFSLEHRKRMSISRSGIKHWNWDGGKSNLITKIRTSFEYRQWRSDIFTRDNWDCQNCQVHGGRLHVHHIKPLSVIIKENKVETIENAKECEEIWNINNGITLCIDCHKKTDSYLKRPIVTKTNS